MHRYSVGQFVELTPSIMRFAAPGEYEIRQTMPAPDVSSASPRYRIKSVAEIYERIVSETELTLPKGASQALPAEPTDMQLPGLSNEQRDQIDVVDLSEPEPKL
jgi:hypothetical protein